MTRHPFTALHTLADEKSVIHPTTSPAISNQTKGHTMNKTVEFFFDFGSPASYLAWTQLPRIAKAQCAQIIWRPMLLGGVFKATGNQSPVLIPSKGRWMLQDLAREVVAQVLSAAGFDTAEFEQLVNDEAVKEHLKATTEEAIKRGVFGAPTFFIGTEMHFGQDRLDFVADALAR
jgi:2-hydroxychromene-2-carboxylate isomerase